MKRSIYEFKTLEDALLYYERLGIWAEDVKIEGAWGGSTPTEDDDPVFITEEE